MTPARPGPGGPPGAPEGHRLPRSGRIRRSRDIRRLLRRGKRKKTAHLDVFFAASPVSRPRLGLIVPKHGRRIVDRNRLKRRVLEVGRTEVVPRLWKVEPSLDLMVRARREAYGVSFQELRDELVEVTERICSNARSWG